MASATDLVHNCTVQAQQLDKQTNNQIKSPMAWQNSTNIDYKQLKGCSLIFFNSTNKSLYLKYLDLFSGGKKELKSNVILQTSVDYLYNKK